MGNIDISQYGNLLIFKKGYSSSFIKSTIEKKHLNGLRIISILSDQKIDNLDFLGEMAFLDTLEISSIDDYNFNFLYNLHNLKRLSIEIYGKSIIDLTEMTGLQSLFLYWRKNIKGLNKCQNLRKLGIYGYKKVTLEYLSDLHNLKELQLKSSSINSLKGIEHFFNIEHISLGNCRILDTINDLNGLKKLKILDFNSCTKINDFSGLTDLPSLEELRLIDCKEILSVSFIKKLKSLNTVIISGNTKVIDNNLEALKGITNVKYSKFG